MLMDSKFISKILLALMPVFLLSACEKKWETSIDLGVNSTRINVASQLEGDLIIPVYSNMAWAATVSQGSDWLVLDSAVGHGHGYLDVHYGMNETDPARIGKIRIVAGEKAITVHVVQSGMAREASSVSDLEL